MKISLKITFIFMIGCTAIACNSRNAHRAKNSAADIVIKNAWARTANKGANSAVYLTIINHTATADTLTGIITVAAHMAGVHKTVRRRGMTGMAEAKNPVIKPNSTFILEPGGYHIMLMDLNQKLTRGDSIQLRLEFAVSGLKKIRLPVGKK